MWNNLLTLLLWMYNFLSHQFIQELSSSWDRRPFGHNTHGPKSGGCCAPFCAGVPIQHNVAWAKAYLLTNSISIHQPFDHNRHWAEKWGLLCPFRWELAPHLTCGLGRGLPLYQVASWSIQPSGHIRHGLKIGRGALSIFMGLGLHQCGLGRDIPPYQVASWSIHLATETWAENWGCCAPLFWELVPHLRQCGLGRGLTPHQVASWFIQPSGHNTPTLQTDSTDNGLTA